MDQQTVLRNHALFQQSWTGWSCDHANNQSQLSSSRLSQSNVSSLRSKSDFSSKQKPSAQSSFSNTSSMSSRGPKPRRKRPVFPMVHVSIDPLSARRSKRSTRRRPWSEDVPTSSARSEDFDLVYEAFLPKGKWVEYKAREYVTNPRYGQLYEVRKEKPRPKPQEEPISWLWEEKFRLWRLEMENSHQEKGTGRKSRGVSEVTKGHHVNYVQPKSDSAKPHADLFASYHNQKLTRQRRDLAATAIQQVVRGWLVRQHIRQMKRQALLGLGRAWPKVTKEYRELVTRIQARHGVMKTSCPVSLDELQDYIDKREKYERVFERVAIGDKLSRDQLTEFLNESGHFPTEGEITAAFNAVFRGSGTTAEVVFVLDCSTSLGIISFHDQMTFVKDVVRYLHIGPDRVRVGVVPYNTNVFDVFGLLQYSTRDDIINAIDQIQFRPGLTHTDVGLRIMRDMFKDARPGVQKVAVVITDGRSANTQQTALQAKKAADDNITLFALGVGNNVDKLELEEIARDITRVYMVSDYRALIELKYLLGSKLCLQSDREEDGYYHKQEGSAPQRGTAGQSQSSEEVKRQRNDHHNNRSRLCHDKSLHIKRKMSSSPDIPLIDDVVTTVQTIDNDNDNDNDNEGQTFQIKETTRNTNKISRKDTAQTNDSRGTDSGRESERKSRENEANNKRCENPLPKSQEDERTLRSGVSAPNTLTQTLRDQHGQSSSCLTSSPNDDPFISDPAIQNSNHKNSSTSSFISEDNTTNYNTATKDNTTTTATSTNDDSGNSTAASQDDNSTINDHISTIEDYTESDGRSWLQGSVQDVCRPLTKEEALDTMWTLYPPPATGLPQRQSRWIRPLVDGEEAWSLLDENMMKATDFKVCLGLVVKSRLEREGVITIPSDVRAGVEEVTTYDEAMQKIEEYLENRRKREQPLFTSTA